ncbi:MAG: flippase-like domain-containing protein [Planctomycetes bacterium]|nr:flippase-like domain-containing protein [Planctomycetota bacterium]
MRTALRVTASLAVAALLVALLMAWGGVDAGEIASGWKRVSAGTLLAATATYALQYVFRAERFRVLFPPAVRPRFGTTLSVTAAYGMATLILPAKLGEATFLVYLNRAAGAGTNETLAALVVARLLDFASLFLGFGIASLGLAASGAHAELAWLAPLGAALVAAAIAVLGLAVRGDVLVRIATGTARALGLARFAVGRRLVERVDSLAGALRDSARDGRAVRAAVLSLPMWACVFAFCALLGRGFGLPESVGFAAASFGASLAILTSIVPLSAFANFGTLEAGWVLGFGIFGVSREVALATGTGLHVVQLVLAIAFGVAGHVGMGLVARSRSDGAR